MVAFVYTMEENSLDPTFHNQYVKSGILNLEKAAHGKLAIALVGKSSTIYAGPCKCSSRSHFLLLTHFLTLSSPLFCGGCDRSVPLYKIPLYDGENSSYYKILSWQSNYQACDQLQINCEVGERWGMRQMQDVHSELSRQGLEICKRIEALTGTPTYYFLFNYRNISLIQDRKRPCPSCGGQWQLEEALHGEYHFKCENCRLISSETCNSR
jgi:predicted  nucleic acid-binding Zn ribbon protein